jgi:hypothetical protein
MNYAYLNVCLDITQNPPIVKTVRIHSSHSSTVITKFDKEIWVNAFEARADSFEVALIYLLETIRDYPAYHWMKSFLKDDAKEFLDESW